MTSGVEQGQLASVQRLQDLVNNTFPPEEIVYAFGYGSGVLAQQQLENDKDDERKMIDLVLVVSDTCAFHQANLAVNASHYATPFWLNQEATAKYVTWWQRHKLDIGILRNPGVYFHVTDHIKYGVVQVEDLLLDLAEWKYLYLAGRLHKPVVTILDRQQDANLPHSNLIQYQQDQHNLPAALSAALLLLSSESSCTIPETKVYEKIASLSYSGDFRTTIGAEDPLKVRKLVESPGQLQRFRQLYAPCAQKLAQEGILSVSDDRTNTAWTWDSTCSSAQTRLWNALPASLRQLNHANHPTACVNALEKALAGIVAPAARYQSFKGLISAGLTTSVAYAARKLSKGLLRR